jgi:hypothetical protein
MDYVGNNTASDPSSTWLEPRHQYNASLKHAGWANGYTIVIRSCRRLYKPQRVVVTEFKLMARNPDGPEVELSNPMRRGPMCEIKSDCRKFSGVVRLAQPYRFTGTEYVLFTTGEQFVEGNYNIICIPDVDVPLELPD